MLSADEATGLNAGLLEDILAGKNSTVMNIPINGVGAFEFGPIELRPTDSPPTFDPALSAVAWLEINDGADANLGVIWPHPAAARPVTLRDPGD